MLLSEQYNKIVINVDNRPEADIVGNVKQFSNTSLNDWIDAQFVMTKSINGCCLWSELDNFIYSSRKLESFSESEQLSFEGYHDSEGFTSVEAIRLQKHILHHSNDCDGDANDPACSCKVSDDTSCKSSCAFLDLHFNLNREEEIRKLLLSTVNTFLNSEGVSMKLLLNIMKR